MRKAILLSLCVICWLTAPAASKDDDSSANQLFVEAAQLINSAKETSATRAFTLLRNAERKLQAIVQHHPSSNLAVKLVSKQPIGSISLAGVANAIKKVSAQAGSRVFSETLDVLELAEDADSRAALLAEVAIAQANFGDVEGSRRTSAKVLTVANSINDGYDRVDTLLKVAEAQTQTGSVEDARETLNEAFTTARSLEDHNGLLAVARAQAEAGDMKAAKEILDEALTEARSREVESRIYGLLAVARAQAETEDMKTAREILDEALATAESAGLAHRMWHIALQRLQIGDVKGAMATVRTSRRLTGNDNEALNSFSIIAQEVYNPIPDGTIFLLFLLQHVICCTR